MLCAYALHDPHVRYLVSTTTYLCSMDKQIYPSKHFQECSGMVHFLA